MEKGKIKVKITRQPNAKYKKGQVVSLDKMIAEHYLNNDFATLAGSKEVKKGGCTDCQSKEDLLQGKLDEANIEIGTLTEANQALTVKLALLEESPSVKEDVKDEPKKDAKKDK